ncbi:TetR/AcrR family transcriptional regulator [Aliikangiella marina]|uniref:TetR/AcrR family transcriptional regulator n=1 Tax=Aliikangiella marina TaxID=1712262 RepID=A0A545TI75_9GAMM|nr:TetR/AcrR family transcriptional regulator [Aliikangiella marina]TQV76871.1 TetR/AcrR family transcriptional regulator [Aliikangiella marina]
MKLTDIKKQQIIQGAVAEFHKNGFSGTSMDAIAQTANVSKRTVYNHFPSKDELFIGIVQHMFGLVEETHPAPYDPGIDFYQQLERIARQKIELFSSEEFISLSRVVMPEALHSPEKMEEALAQISTIESNMINWFQQAIDDEKINSQDANDVCFTFMGLIKMDAYYSRLYKGKEAPDQVAIEQMVKKAVDLFVGYYCN